MYKGHPINKAFFDKPSREMYYILGAFYSNCRIHKDKKGFTFTSQHEDLVDIVKDHLGSTRKTIEHTHRNSYWVDFDNKPDLVEKLESFGITENKYERQYPEMPEEFQSDFVRGFFDAKAGYLPKKAPSAVEIKNFPGKFLAELHNVLVKYAGVKTGKRNSHLMYSQGDAKKIHSFIYQNYDRDCNRSHKKIMLIHKKKQFDRLIKHVKRISVKQREIKRRNEQAVQMILDRRPTWEIAEKLFNGSPSAFYAAVQSETGMRVQELKLKNKILLRNYDL